MADGKQTTGTDGAGGRRAKAGRTAGGRGKKGDGASEARPPKTGRGAAERPRSPARTNQPDLKRDLRDFASARPEGWNHEDWLGFLESLQARGHDIRDREAIGVALEKERLDLALSRIRGVGPQRRAGLVARYGTIWTLRHADVDEIAQVGNMPRSLAEQVKQEMQ